MAGMVEKVRWCDSDRTTLISLRTTYLSNPYEPSQLAYHPLFEAGYLLISFHAPMCKVLLLIVVTYSNAYLLY